MKNIVYLIFLTLLSCNPINNFYQGRVTDEKNNPLWGVTVAEDRIEKQTKTDKNGYFKLDRSPNWLGRLIFVKDGYKTDTIPTVWHQAGETIEYNFVKNDTTTIQLRLSEIKEVNDISKKETSNLKKDTLQYIMDGENEDNIYSMFLTKKLDTLCIVLTDNQHIDSNSKNQMYFAEWQNELITNGGDSEIKYQQAFMKKLTRIKTKPFK